MDAITNGERGRRAKRCEEQYYLQVGNGAQSAENRFEFFPICS